MTITIDCRMIDASGIGVYLRGCLPYLLQSNNDFLLIGNSKKINNFKSFQNVKIIECDVKPFSLNELFFFPLKVLKQINKTETFYSPFFNIPCGLKIPVFTTIHDIIFPDMPEITSKAGLAVRMFFFKRSQRKSKCIFTVSNFSKTRIEHHLGKTKPVIVTYSAIQRMYLNFRENAKNIQKKETIIFIGNIKKHKGLDCLLDAYKLAKDEGLPHKLIIIGSKENFRTSDNVIIKKIETFSDDSIVFTGFISDETLMEHLSCASLLVQPSLYEGFCLPPLEALVLGTNALISDIPVLKEVYSEFPVFYFKAGDTLNLKENIIQLLINNNLKPLLLNEQLLNKYTFEKTASIILSNIRSLINEN